MHAWDLLARVLEFGQNESWLSHCFVYIRLVAFASLCQAQFELLAKMADFSNGSLPIIDNKRKKKL